MFLVLALLITLGLWLLEKMGYAQFTFHEMLYPLYAFGFLLAIQLLISIVVLILFKGRINRSYFKV